jgi:myo-inositol-1(or 4)-monophosphatase
MNYQELCLQVVELAKVAGSFIYDESKKTLSQDDVEVKGLHNFVTYVDKAAEKTIVEGLSKLLPEAGFIAEEGTSDKKGTKYNWIIDPLDGTTNFIHRMPPFAVSIALMEDEEVVIGVIYEVNLKEAFYTWKGASSYLNGAEIKVSQANKIQDSLIATGFPYYNFDKLAMYMNTMDYFMKKSHGLRRIGSAATDLAYVAAGRFEAFYEYSLSPWDVAAGALLVQNAGGRVFDFSKGKNYIFGKEIIASNAAISDEFAEVILNLMKTSDK